MEKGFSTWKLLAQLVGAVVLVCAFLLLTAAWAWA